MFNLVNGTGRDVGDALSRHPGVDMISFTGSTGPAQMVGAAAADTVKRVCLELGGKSANIVLPDADLEKAARWNIQRCFFNAGQSCHAPSRMLVHESQIEQVVPFLVDEADRFRLGDPLDSSTTMGPVVSAAQYKSIRDFIQSGLDEGAHLVTGGLERPDGLDQGYFVQPTVFTGVTPDMTIAREEIFGPVLAVMPYRDEDDALRIANDSPYGLGGYVFGGDRAQRPPRRQRPAGRTNQLQRRGHGFVHAHGRIQAVRHRSLDGPIRARGIPRGQIRLRLRGRGASVADSVRLKTPESIRRHRP